VRTSSRTIIQRELPRLLASARARWPDVPLDPRQLVEHLAERLGEAGTEETLAKLRTDELYLARACLDGNPQAIALLREHCAVSLDAGLARLRLSPEAAGESKQALWELLLTSREGRQPALAGYGGQGRLAGWVAVVGVRTAMKQLSRSQREVPVSGDLLDDLFAGNTDPEIEYLKISYGEQFKEAFRQAFRLLTPRQRNLLRQHFVDGVAIHKLAAVYKVHRTTVWRWICVARDAIAANTRVLLMQQVGVNESECESILRLIESRMDLTVRTATERE
jgi:RNA polymerase sigma-70 factor (ECF subfamily)